MRKLNWGPLFFGSFGMLVIILDGKTAVSGVRSGIELCLNTLIPSLFPFFVLSALVTGSVSGRSIRPLRSVCRFCRMSPGTESFLAVGLLGGYPVGAANISSARSKGSLTPEEASRIVIFCNNAGPSFLFGILGPLFPSPIWLWLLWAIQIGASLLTGCLLPGGFSNSVRTEAQRPTSLPDCLNRSVRSMTLVCGWVILFRMVLAFLQRWFLWLLPVPAQVVFTGLLELSNGCLALNGIKSHALRFVVSGVMLSLGGICVWMQTSAVFPQLNLSHYIGGRIIHCMLCLWLSGLILPILIGAASTSRLTILLSLAISGIILILILRKHKKAVAFYSSMMYNGV